MSSLAAAHLYPGNILLPLLGRQLYRRVPSSFSSLGHSSLQSRPPAQRNSETSLNRNSETGLNRNCETRLNRNSATSLSSSAPSFTSRSASPGVALSDVSSMAPRTVMVDVTSDTVCPWCFVGKKNLEAAIGQLRGNVDVEVKWRPFQLNPNAPKEGIDKQKFYVEKFGPKVPAIMERMSAIFASLGHQYSLGGKTGNTLDSHRLLWWALHGPQGSAEKQNALAEELFLDYFTREKFIGDSDVLVAAAERVGLEGAREFLANPEAGYKEVQQELKEYGRGVTGVPFFRIDGQELSGAQPPEVFVEALQRAAA